MSSEVTENDEAKVVVAGNGDHIGIVDDVRDGTAYVDPDPGVSSELKSKLGWGSTERDTYPLRNDAVDKITDEAIHLRSEY
ncbi:PRC-barrel domain containing protein [Haladaptatus salinisoli]|uniref:PRC-barrel domain containing protein n=1 Tax=Haladaptatus salinisoli TaxID=2884876 RepID=UPI001D0ABD11|nr:PRC-barrel domain containing protein [Haladaptatus salinisoli]